MKKQNSYNNIRNLKYNVRLYFQNIQYGKGDKGTVYKSGYDKEEVEAYISQLENASHIRVISKKIQDNRVLKGLSIEEELLFIRDKLGLEAR